jgi:hypothetical protein
MTIKVEDRTKTLEAALGEPSLTHHVACGPYRVPYLSLRGSELRRMQSGLDGFAFMEFVYDVLARRMGDTAPAREAFEDGTGVEEWQAFLADLSGGKKHPN